MSAMASQITNLKIVTHPFIQIADQRKLQSSASPAFVREIHRWPVNFPYKRQITRKIFQFGDVIITSYLPHHASRRAIRNMQLLFLRNNLFNPNGCLILIGGPFTNID